MYIPTSTFLTTSLSKHSHCSNTITINISCLFTHIITYKMYVVEFIIKTLVLFCELTLSIHYVTTALGYFVFKVSGVDGSNKKVAKCGDNRKISRFFLRGTFEEFRY